MSRKPTAYPELIRPGDWRVEEWVPNGEGIPPCTSNGDRRMIVPVGNGPFAREVRFHEQLHVKYSPDGVPADTGATTESLLAAEDCRVNLKGALIRPHDSIKYGPAVDAFMVATKMSERDLARLVAASIGYTSCDEWCESLSSDLHDVAENRAFPPWLRSHARELALVISAVQNEAPGYCYPVAFSTFQDTINLAMWLDQFADKQAEPEKGKGPTGDDENEDYDDAPDDGGEASNAKWGEMKIETPPLTVQHPNRLGRRTSPSQEGARMVHFNRLVTGEVYGRARKRATPDAVLIDQSGSMHWDPTKLHELVRQLPAGIVATYSGANGEGVLRVVARDGRMVAPSLVAPYSGGNEVDGPALRWLAKQHGRKVWVSDQGVCTDVCRDEEALLADCKAVMKGAGIRACLTDKPADVMKALRGR